jgi:hypothetical protein
VARNQCDRLRGEDRGMVWAERDAPVEVRGDALDRVDGAGADRVHDVQPGGGDPDFSADHVGFKPVEPVSHDAHPGSLLAPPGRIRTRAREGR